MKKYSKPEIEVEELDVHDIIYTSTGTDTPIIGGGEGSWSML